MRIEEISKSTVGEAGDQELLMLRLRMTQLWDKHFKESTTEVVGSLSRGEMLQKHRFLIEEMRSRSLEQSTSDIDRQVFKAAMRSRTLGVDIAGMDDVIVVKNLVIAKGKFGSDADGPLVVIMQVADIPTMEESLTKAVGEITSRSFTVNEGEVAEGDEVLPLYDLVLKAKRTAKLTKSVVKLTPPIPYHGGAVGEHHEQTDNAVLKDTKKQSRISVVKGRGELKLLVSGIPPNDVSGINKDQENIEKSMVNAKQLSLALSKTLKAKPAVVGLKLSSDSFGMCGLLKVGSVKGLAQLGMPKDVPFALDTDFEKSAPWFNNTTDSISLGSSGKKRTLACRVDSFDFTMIHNGPYAKRFKIAGSTILPEGEYIVEQGVNDEWMFSRRLNDQRFIDVKKLTSDDEERIVYGVVYEPDVDDAHGEYANEEDIRLAAHQFMQNVQKFKVNHKGKVAKVRVLESYVAPQDLTIEGMPVSKGTWLMSARVLDDDLWDAVKSGELTGFSMAGLAVRIEEN